MKFNFTTPNDWARLTTAQKFARIQTIERVCRSLGADNIELTTHEKFSDMTDRKQQERLLTVELELQNRKTFINTTINHNTNQPTP